MLVSLLLLPSRIGAQTWSSGSSGAQGVFPPSSPAPPGGTTGMTVNLNDGKVTYSPSGTVATLPNVPTGGFRDGVLNFTTINVASGVTVWFARNAANTPVILLATGSVMLSGTLDVSGNAAGNFGRPGYGGPGGFDGGAGGDGLTTAVGGLGLGPGGGGGGTQTGPGGGGGYGSGGSSGSQNYCGGGGCAPGTGGGSYGSSLLRPMVGGSGGGGAGGYLGSSTGGGGGGGGGAILIAASASIAITGNPAIRANGAQGGSGGGGGGGGSGGAIRLIAPSISGSGSLQAQAGSGTYYGGAGGNGRIRLEATTLTYTGTTTPLTVTSLPQPIFPGTGQPALAIASIGGIAAPPNPTGSVLGAPDVMLPVGTPNPVAVGVTASNVPMGTTVQVSATPQSGARTTATCTLLDGTQASSTCSAGISISLTQTNILTASATFPLVASAGSGPIYAEGEEVEWVKVSSTLGGPSTVTYITSSGKEVPATAIARRLP